MSFDAPLFAAIGVMLFWVALGLAGLARSDDGRFVFRILFPLGSIAGAVLAAVGLAGVSADAGCNHAGHSDRDIEDEDFDLMRSAR